jgi:hypothetical protein
MFKHRFWEQAVKFWKLAREDIKPELQIHVLYNLSIVDFLDNHIDASLDTCQDLIRETCMYLTEETNYQDEKKLNFIGFVRKEDVIKRCKTILSEHTKYFTEQEM